MRRMGPTAIRLLLLLVLSIASAAGAMPPDSDGDGVHDYADNCLDVPNRDQANTDRAGEPQGSAPMGNACDCDFDNDGFCGIPDFDLFLPDFVAGVDSGLGTDMDGVPGVGIGDFNRFLPGFAASVPGPGALPGSVVDGTCDPLSEPGCSDPFTPGACFDARVGGDLLGAERPWRVRPRPSGCPIDPQVLIDAGFDAAAADPNNPADAWVRDQTGGTASCPNAAFAGFPAGTICGPGVPCDPRDHGRRCGEPNNRGGLVACGDVSAPLACEQLSLCGGQCGYRDFDCAEQFHRNLIATCDALAGRERAQCRDACIGFANLYASERGVPDPGPGSWSTTDLADQAALCRCGTDPIADQPPSVCGDGVCEGLSESCHVSSCQADCGACDLGTACLIDADCGTGVCGRTGRCELGTGGAPCDADPDCTSGSCLGGQCTSACGDGVCDGQETCGTTTPGACELDCGVCPYTGACTDASDCASGACDTNACAALPSQAGCTTAEECVSGLCHNGRCLAGPGDAGFPCFSDSECRGDPANPGIAGICDAGFCSPTPRTTGSACQENRACQTNIDPNKVLPPIGVCNLGTCLGQPVPIDGPCDRDEACAWVCDGSGLVCGGICNEGVCIDRQLDEGESCDSQLACGPGLFCSSGTCRKAGFASCSSGADCASGLCEPTTGTCQPQCGDGFCDVRAGEICGLDDILTCRADCGQCGILDGVISQVGLCLNHENCDSGICNFGICLAGPLSVGSPCSSNLACFSGACNFGECIEELIPEGGHCSTDAVCETGACNFGECFPAGAFQDGAPCTSSEACEGGACNFGICTTPRPDGSLCSQDSACASDACNFGFCVAAGSLQTLDFCLSDNACEAGLCSSLLDAITKFPVTPGVCMDQCGDGLCTGLETCGFSNVLTRCNEDCGYQCGDGSLCLTGHDCASGICNAGQCIPAGLSNGSFCTSNKACSSGVCNFGICMTGGLADSFPCSTHAACESGLCSFGLCTQGGHPNNSLCTANAACASTVCNAAVCIDPGSVAALNLCTTDAACHSGDCVAGLCKQVCGDGWCDGLELCGDENQFLQCNADCNLCGIGTPCTSNSTCGSGVCNFAFCHAGNLAPGKFCSTDAACRSGNCIAGVCGSSCGDGFCDGAELCGDSNSGLECNRDCNKCGNGTPCLSNSTCSSNACNFGFCITYRSLGRFSPCTTDNACSSLNCSFGLCGR